MGKSWTKGKRGTHRGEVALSLTRDRIPEWYYKPQPIPSHGRSYLHPALSSARAEKVVRSHYYSLHSSDMGSWIKREDQRLPNYKSDFKCYWQITEKNNCALLNIPHSDKSYSKVSGGETWTATAVPLLHCWGRQRSRQVPAPLLNILEPREITRGITDKHLLFFTYQTHI